MDTPPIRCVDALQRGAMTRRSHRRSIVKGQITLPAVPGMIDAYLSMCESLLATVGRPFTPEQPAHVKSVLQGRLAEAYTRRFRARSRTAVLHNDFHVPGVGDRGLRTASAARRAPTRAMSDRDARLVYQKPRR